MRHTITFTVEVDDRFCEVLKQKPQALVAEALLHGFKVLQERYDEEVCLLCSKNEQSN